ncbi:MAG TPA: hypothetical protein VH207_07720 [Chthoniobacterales bacterium]|jgi:hypothetical protein|nr:hypothetical protein [Chthoniobacterales bacterium]
MKKLILGVTCCAFIAPLAFGQDPPTVTLENGLKVTAKAPVITVARGEAASYQPRKTLVVYHEGSGAYVLNGRGHVFDQKGQNVRSAVRPGASVQVYFAKNGGAKTIDHVVVN